MEDAVVLIRSVLDSRYYAGCPSFPDPPSHIASLALVVSRCASCRVAGTSQTD
jgi:hypothetical protein